MCASIGIQGGTILSRRQKWEIEEVQNKIINSLFKNIETSPKETTIKLKFCDI
jgi:hypothetical protein